MALKPKQQRFVQEYLIDLNATAAARRAGYSESTAEVIGYENLRKPQIAAAISAAQQERAERTGVTADEVILELKRLGFSRMTDFSSWGPDGVRLKKSEDLTPGQAAAVSEVTETVSESGGNRKIKLHSKPAALELLGRHLGMFKDSLNINLDLKNVPDADLDARITELEGRIIQAQGGEGPPPAALEAQSRTADTSGAEPG